MPDRPLDRRNFRWKFTPPASRAVGTAYWKPPPATSFASNTRRAPTVRWGPEPRRSRLCPPIGGEGTTCMGGSRMVSRGKKGAPELPAPGALERDPGSISTSSRQPHIAASRGSDRPPLVDQRVISRRMSATRTDLAQRSRKDPFHNAPNLGYVDSCCFRSSSPRRRVLRSTVDAGREAQFAG
jgi:hypothetical protein